MPTTVDLVSARMSYAAAIVGCMTYGMYLVLAVICILFLLKKRIATRSQKVILGYTILMLITSTIYFVSASIWSEIEFVESTVDINVFDTLLNSHLAILKDTSYTVNIWLADSLLIYRLLIIWGWYLPIILLPACLWVATVATGIGLLVNSAQPLANLNQGHIIHYEVAFYCSTVTHNVLCTLFIAGRLWYQQRTVKNLRTSGNWSYSSIIAVVVESAALYSLCGIIYIPLIIRMLPLQFPITALIGSLTSIAPNLIILRIALGTAVSSETLGPTTTMAFKLSTLRSGRNTDIITNSDVTAVQAFDSRSTVPMSGGDDAIDIKSMQFRSTVDGGSIA